MFISSIESDGSPKSEYFNHVAPVANVCNLKFYLPPSYYPAGGGGSDTLSESVHVYVGSIQRYFILVKPTDAMKFGSVEEKIGGAITTQDIPD